jgi:hypothetical protein
MRSIFVKLKQVTRIIRLHKSLIDNDIMVLITLVHEMNKRMEELSDKIDTVKTIFDSIIGTEMSYDEFKERYKHLEDEG